MRRVPRLISILGCGAGIVIITLEGDELQFAVKFEFRASNNEAEYEALIRGVRMDRDLGAQYIVVFSDSQLVTQQISGAYEKRNVRMLEYAKQVEEWKSQFEHFEVRKVSRA